MPSDLTAAAKRVSEARAAVKDGIGLPWVTEPYTSIGMGATRYIADLEIVADAYAAERDDTPLAAELLDQILGPRALDSGVWVRDDWVVTLRDGTADLWNRDRYDRYLCRTLGDLRTATRQAGIQATNTETT